MIRRKEEAEVIDVEKAQGGNGHIFKNMMVTSGGFGSNWWYFD